MRGYMALQQFYEDHKLYKTAKSIDTGRDSGETITSFMKKRIDNRFLNASKSFKSKGYTKDDLVILATNESFKKYYNFSEFLNECFEKKSNPEANIKKILSSKPFKDGKLKNLYTLLPIDTSSKNDLFRFLRSRGTINNTELEILMKRFASRNWKKWLNELLEERKVRRLDGMWLI